MKQEFHYYLHHEHTFTSLLKSAPGTFATSTPTAADPAFNSTNLSQESTYRSSQPTSTPTSAPVVSDTVIQQCLAQTRDITANLTQNLMPWTALDSQSQVYPSLSRSHTTSTKKRASRTCPFTINGVSIEIDHADLPPPPAKSYHNIDELVRDWYIFPKSPLVYKNIAIPLRYWAALYKGAGHYKYGRRRETWARWKVRYYRCSYRFFCISTRSYILTADFYVSFAR